MITVDVCSEDADLGTFVCTQVSVTQRSGGGLWLDMTGVVGCDKPFGVLSKHYPDGTTFLFTPGDLTDARLCSAPTDGGA